ncbi:NTE family protein [Nocardioides marinisabuli]|uniref:NTE family protein n=1 Tax=Nocardioides marinisabuli TaxID=419476 RepID=A0A7Y9EZT5_9ACTN|nr:MULTISPECIES: patatin-like phospholipase family protein [Nocardioides]NYD56746.1 NTE family protein [Nocardioides marinisabuli]
MKALVLGGGGITGIAWETGLLAGLADAGVDLTGADRVVGTSAGSIVGSQVTSDTPLDELYRRQLLEPGHPEGPTEAALAAIGPRVLATYAVAVLRSRRDPEVFGRLLGSRAVRAAARGRTPSIAERYDQVRQRLTTTTWPERDLVVTAVDAATGELAAFRGGGDVGLEDAVNASCAVPCVYPPIPIGGRTYVDGGMRSGANADLAAGCDPVVVLSPLDRSVGPLRSARQQLAELGVPHLVITPDDGSRAAIGSNVLDPAARPGSARAGHAQAAAHVARVRELWG